MIIWLFPLSFWLSAWSDRASNQTTAERDMYLGVYGGLGVAQAIFTVLASVTLYFSTLGNFSIF